jgi:hypothetical protein
MAPSTIKIINKLPQIDLSFLKSIFLVAVVAILAASCSLPGSPLSSKDVPRLYPILQDDGYNPRKFGYIDQTGEIIIQPQFAEAWFFSEGLAVACVEHGKCGYIDETGRFAVNPQFNQAARFSEGLAAVSLGGKIGFIDKTGKFVINPQFQIWRDVNTQIFSEGLSGVVIGGKYGFVDKTGKIVINPQFDDGLPFMEGLAPVRMGDRWGFVDKNGKIVVNPQFEMAHPFVNGLAAAKIGNQWGYVDKAGKIVINPQFDLAAPFAEEGVALVALNNKIGYVDKEGKYIVNPQFTFPRGPNIGEDLIIKALSITSDLGRLSFSEGFVLANIGQDFPNARFGYADKTGKIVINPQFDIAFPFYGNLALVVTMGGQRGEEFAWIDKAGKIVWQQKKVSPSQPNTNAAINSSYTPSNNVNSASNAAPTDTSKRTGRLSTDSNIRSEPNKDALSLGIHFKGAKISVLDHTTYMREDGETTWYKVRITEYGCSVNTNLGCGKNSPNDTDEGWINSKNILLD